MKKLLLTLLLLLFALIAILFINTYSTASHQLPRSGKRISYPIDQEAIARLQKAIQFKTISYDDASLIDSAAFWGLQNLIDTSFPLVKQNLEKTVIHNFSLIYHWKAKKTTTEPSILYAHLDVVPVESVNRNDWSHDPWSGEIVDGFLWGRGTLDDKSSAMGILEAAEKLIHEGYEPTNDIYFVFGHDEEIGGMNGAGGVSTFFKAQGLKTKFHLDEGGMCTSGMVPFMEQPVILLGTAEKGYMTINLTVKIKGGHSSKPEKETATGVLVRALAKIEKHSFPQQMSPVLKDFVDYVGPEMKMPARLLFTNRWLFSPIILSEYQKVGGDGNAITRTTSAITIIKAGVKDNVIPSEASAVVNFRILTGSDCKTILSEIRTIVNDERVIIEPTNNTFEPPLLLLQNPMDSKLPKKF